jgi:hypothetical protein
MLDFKCFIKLSVNQQKILDKLVQSCSVYVKDLIFGILRTLNHGKAKCCKDILRPETPYKGLGFSK